MSPEELASTLEQLADIDLAMLSQQDDFVIMRPRALAAARRLCQRLETPLELSRRLAWQEPSHTVAIKIAMDLNLFEYLSKVGANGSIPAKDLADASKGNEELVARILRLLAAWGTVREVDAGLYAPNAVSDGLLDPKIYSGIDFWFHFSITGLGNLPKFLRENDYAKLDVPAEGNWAKGPGNGLHLFAWMNEHPNVLRSFGDHMAGFSEGRATWVQLYPTAERIIAGADAEGPLLVDVGGSFGQDVARFNKKHPQPPGRLFVQDLEAVVEEGKKNNSDPAIEFQPHDFNNRQPIQGARAYFLHSILHDWSDEICNRILSQIRTAMKPGYSKVVLGEFVVASRHPDPFCTTLDLTVTAMSGSKERTEAAWRQLLSDAGLQLTGIWSSPSANGESVLEAELA